MAGQPLKGELARMLNARTAVTFEGETGKDALDYVCSWLENGQTMLELARSCTKEKYPDAALFDESVVHFTPNLIRRVLLDLHPRDIIDRRTRDSRTVGAHAAVDLATAIIDDVDAFTKEAVTHAKERANVRLWTASRHNRAELGDAPKTAVQVNVSAGDAHVDAMERFRRRVVLPSASSVPALAVVEAEQAPATTD